MLTFIQNTVCNLLDSLEYITMNISYLRNWVLKVHETAFSNIFALDLIEPPIRFIIVGGGIFPRTAIIIRNMFPDAQIVIQDMNHKSLECAENYMKDLGITDNIIYFKSRYTGVNYDVASESVYGTVVILPLAFRGGEICQTTFKTVKHCWLWENHPCEKDSIVSYFLLKKIVMY